MLLVVCPSQGFKGDRTSTLHCACACALYYRFSVGKAAVAGSLGPRSSPSRTWWTWARLRRRWTKTARLITSKGSAVRSTHPLSTPPISAHSHTHTRLRLPSSNATLQNLTFCMPHALRVLTHARALSLPLSRLVTDHVWTSTAHRVISTLVLVVAMVSIRCL